MARTVLLISQDQKVRGLVKSTCQPDARVIDAANGLAAMFICAFEMVDALVVDPGTPGMNLPRLVEKLSSAFPGMPVITLAVGETGTDLADKLRMALDSTACRKQPGTVEAAFRAQRGA
jgi:DNA-binding NtrC family response regulator